LNEYKSHDEAIVILRELFGDNRAEWPSKHFKDLFVEPSYLKKLESLRPCILVGGRGTGKTTSLQSLKYTSTLERLEASGLGFGDLEYFGVLVRMNKNRVRAFQGKSTTEVDWQKLFSHYFNLLICLELTALGDWLEQKTGKKIHNDLIERISIDLGVDKATNICELKTSVKNGISKLQVVVNNPSKATDIILSMAEAPLRSFVEALADAELLGGRIVFCCIDEYENLLDYQQAIINTYIKHAEPPLSYKVGVRKNGIRNRQTLDRQDLLRAPDDYAEIEIADEGFELFAKAVADLRLKCAIKNNINVAEPLSKFLGELPYSEEAIILGANRVSEQVLNELQSSDEELFTYFSTKPISEVYFLKYWQECVETDLVSLAKDWMENETAWSTRIGNHGYASLFWLSRGNRGARIRKYYCGSNVFLSLPAGNIRYFLELIDTAIGYELDNNNYSKTSPMVLSPKSQTLAARYVGKRRLNQLEGLADHGVQLKRLVLAIGKVFFEFARAPSGRTPEVNSFVLTGAPKDVEKIKKLISEGISHLAFEAAPRTKATSSSEMRDDEYRLHRIFCGFFEISHRKKRRTSFNAKHLLEVLEDKPAKAISSLLEKRNQSPEQDLPEQLAFFSAFYDEEQ